MNEKVNFFCEGIEVKLKEKTRIRKWMVLTMEEEHTTVGDINIVLCSDEVLKKLNSKYLNHHYFTDILTFPFSDEEGYISGDIFISYPRVRENAKLFQQTLRDELHRVMIHGILHLIGYQDQTQEEKSLMKAKEDFYLAKYCSE